MRIVKMAAYLLQSQSEYGLGALRVSDTDGRLVLPIGRIAAIISVLLVLAASLWALAAYSQHKAAVRAAETERYLEAFQSGPVAEAWARLSQAWSAEQPRQQALLARFRALPGDGRPALGDYRAFVLESIDERELEDEVLTVLIYFRGLAFCIRTGNCDGALAARRFGDLPWRFRNQHFLYLSEAFPDVPFDVDFQTVAPRQKDRLHLTGP
jgi:hypothetical protein